MILDKLTHGQPLHAVFAAAIALACLPGATFAGQSALEVEQPPGWDAELRHPLPVDLNPDPHVLEFKLEAGVTELEILPGKKTRAWTYNGTIPGPLIRVRVGDRLIVHFTNKLPDPTTIHWHGVRVPNQMDGSPGLTQAPIEPGQSFTYDYVFRDAGTYWYHPHLNSPEQVGNGLYGAIVVEDPADPAEFGNELVLILSDMSLDEDGQLQSPRSGGAFGDLFGREGNVLLVNGRVLPKLKARAGKQQRWRVINAARSRYYRLSQRNHQWIRLGGDNGLAGRSEVLPRVLITPGERADIVFTPSEQPGTLSTMFWIPVNRGYGTMTGRSREPMFEIETVDEPPVEPAVIPGELRRIEPIDIAGAIEQDIELTINLSPDGTTMGINGVMHHFKVVARVGETHVWNVINNTDFAHPFHLHGYFFQVLDDTRVPEWKDTVNIPPKSSLKVAVKFDERPGLWMLHCHILDHAEVGMMGLLEVVDDGSAPTDDTAGHAHGMQH